MKDRDGCHALTSDEPKAEIAEAVERQDPKDKTKTQAGIRLTRAGGTNCPSSSDVPLSWITDVWCNPTSIAEPTEIMSSEKGPLEDDDADPCTIYISMEHADGCVLFDLHPFLIALGILMIFFGCCLQWLGPENQQSVMIFLVRMGTFLAICAFGYERNYFAYADPSEPEVKKDPLKLIIVIILAFLGQWIIGILFRYSMRLAPTLLGLYVGYLFTIYIIIAINGASGFLGLAKAG